MAVSASLQGDIGENLKTVVVIKSSKGFGFGIHKENPVVINKVTENGPAFKAGIKIGDEIVCVEGRSVLDSPHEVVASMIKSKRQVRLLLRPAGACSQVDKRQSDASTLKRERNSIADEVGDASLDRRPSAVSAADFNGDSDSPLGAQLASLKLKYRQSVIGLPRHWRSHKASKIENNSDKDRATASRAEDCHKIMEEKFDQETCAVAPSTAETDSPVQEQQQQCNSGQFSDSDTESHSSSESSSASIESESESDSAPAAGMDTVDSVQSPIDLESLTDQLVQSEPIGADDNKNASSVPNENSGDAGLTPEPKEVDNSGPDVDNAQADDAQLDQQQEASSNVAEIHDSKEAESKPEDDAEEDDEEDPDISIGQFVSGSTSQMPVSDAAESKLKALMDAFSDVQQLKQNKPMLMLFLHLLLSRPNQSAENSGRESLRPLLFDLLVDDWTATSASLKTKHARRAAYEIYSTFLHPQAPLSLSVAMQSIESSEKFEESLADASQSVSRLLESSGQDDGTKAQLALCFDKAQNAVRPALANLVSSAGAWLRARQRDGFDVLGGGDFLPPGCESAIASLLRGGGGVSSSSSDAQRLLTAKLQPHLSEQLRLLRQQPGLGEQLIASCLATIMAHNLKVGQSDIGASVDSLTSAVDASSMALSGPSSSLSSDHHPVGQQLFNCQRSNSGAAGLVNRQRLSIFTGSRSEKTRFGSHSVELASFHSIRHCVSCKALLSGPGPQGYLCTGECGHTIHRVKDCADKLAALPCKRNSNKSLSTKRPRPASCIIREDQADLMLAPPPASLPAARSETNVGPLDADDQQPPRAGSFSRELAPPSSGVAVGRSSSDRETGGKVDHVRFFSSPADKKDPDSERQKIYQSISSHENIQNVPSDFGQYIVQHKVDTRLQQLRSTTGDSKSDFDRLKDYQLALHEILFACMSHVRALTVLDLLFVRTWPESCQEIMKQLGLHFVPRCIQLYKNLLECIGKPSLNEFVATGKITGFGQRLLAWYSDEQNFLNFKLLSLSFGFSRSSRSHTGSKRSTGNEDDIILRLESLRRENAELNRFIQLAEHHEAAQRLDFKAYYSMNMQFTMRMFLLLQTAVKSARKAKSSYKLAERDLPDLEKCQEKAKMVVDYSNFTSVRLKELSRQLVLSSTFKSFWVRCKLDKDHVDRVRDQISHLHTCQLVQTREVAMPGFENYRLRLLVFSEFLLIVSETEEPKGVVKYQLLRHLGQSMSVGGSGSSEASDVGNMGSLRAVSCPPIIPMPNVIHVFEGRQQKSSSSGRQPTEFRMVIDHPSTSRTESLLVVFNLRKDKPKMPFSDRETDTSASDIVESIKKLQERFKAVNINRSGSVNSIGSVTSAPAEMASGSSPLSEDAVASSSTRGSTLTEEKEDDIEDQEDMPLPSLPQSEASSAGEMLHNRSDSPDSSSSPSTPIANEDSSLIVSPGSIDRAADQSQLEPLQDQPSSLSAVGVDEAQIDSLSARQLQLASELRSQLCSVLNLNPESFDAVAEFAQESDQPDTKDGVLVAYKQFEQLLETLPRLMKALLPSSEGPGAAETLLDQLTVGTGKTAKVLQQLSGLQSSDDDKENDLNDVADAGASAESVNPDQQQEAVQQVCNPTTTGVEDFPRDSQQSEQQQEQHKEQTANIEQEKHEFTDTSLAMTHSDDEATTKAETVGDLSGLDSAQSELFSWSVEKASGRRIQFSLFKPDLFSGQPPLVDGDADAAPSSGHCEPQAQLPDAQADSNELGHAD